MHSETHRARFVTWVFILLSLAIGAGAYLKFQGKNEGRAAETVGSAYPEALTGTNLSLVGYRLYEHTNAPMFTKRGIFC